MHPYTAVVAQQQLEHLRADAAEARLARAARADQPRRSRFAAAIASLKAAASPATNEASSHLPKLNEYPYRG
jgi:hypothetical protein